MTDEVTELVHFENSTSNVHLKNVLTRKQSIASFLVLIAFMRVVGLHLPGVTHHELDVGGKVRHTDTYTCV